MASISDYMNAMKWFAAEDGVFQNQTIFKQRLISAKVSGIIMLVEAIRLSSTYKIHPIDAHLTTTNKHVEARMVWLDAVKSVYLLLNF